MPADRGAPRQYSIRYWARISAALCGVLLVLAAAAPAAADADASAAADGLHFSVEQLDGVLTADDELTIAGELRASGAPASDVRVLVTVHQRTDERWRYQQAMDERVVGNVLHSFAQDFPQLEAGSSTEVTLTQHVDQLGVGIPDSQPGVHPVRLQVLVGGEVVDEQMTSIVLVPQQPQIPLAVGLLVPVATAPPLDGDGYIQDPGFLTALEADGSIGGLVTDIRRTSDLPMTLATDGLTVRALQSTAEGYADATGDQTEHRGSDAPAARQATAAFDGLRAAADQEHVDVITMPYASADVVALTRAGLAGEAARQIVEGRNLTESALNTQVLDRVLVPPDGLDYATFGVAADSGIDTLVVDEVYLERPDTANTSPPPVRHGDGFTALVPDPWLAEATHHWADSQPVVTAQRLVGELATIHLERPFTDERGILLEVATITGDVPRGLLPALAEQLGEASFLEPVPLSTLAQTTPSEHPTALAYPGEHRTAELSNDYLDRLETTRAQLGALAGTLVADPVTPSHLDLLVLQAASTHYRGTNTPLGEDLLAAVDHAAETTYASVTILDTEPITLTATEDEIPVAIRSDADIPLQVQVTVVGSRFQVMDEPVKTITLDPNDTALLSYRVRATSAGGTSPIRLVVTDPDGVHTITTGNVVVRSAAASPVALTVSAGALAFLFVWWVTDWFKRRSRRLAAAS